MRWVALLALVGCDRVLALHHFTPDASVAPDAAPPVVTGTTRVRYTTNTFTGCSGLPPCVTVGTYISPDGGGTVELDDGAMVTVEYHADGSFAFPLHRAGQSYRLQLQAGRQLWDLESDQPVLTLAANWPARPDYAAEPALSPTSITYDIGGAQGPLGGLFGSAWLASTGIWTDTPAVAGTVPFAADWRNSGVEIAPLGLLDYTQHGDLLYVLDQDSTQHDVIREWAQLDVDMVNGNASTLTGVFTPAAADRCLSATTAPAAEVGALSMHSTGTDATGAGVDFATQATPAAANGPAGLIYLMVDGFSGAAIPATFSLANQAYTNPFSGTDALVTNGVGIPRAVAAAGATPFMFGVGARVTIIAPADCSTSPTLDTTVVAVPTAIAIAGTALTGADGQGVVLPTTGLVHVTWTDAASGSAAASRDLSGVTVWELDALGGATSPVSITSTSTASDDAWFDASVFHAGATYVLGVADVLGLPQSAQGDETVVAYPYGTTSVLSTTFVVQ